MQMTTLDTILIVIGLLSAPIPAQAQFHTITKENPVIPIWENREDDIADNKADADLQADIIRKEQELSAEKSVKSENSHIRKNVNVIKSSATHTRKTDLPELTLTNLLAEIRRNNIKYPKIVLAQAILETGWFRSSVCRNKHNLFGLTNPRTGNYYEFDHWTESVRAYYTKVQYRYKGGNYLLWLKKIGYAEDPGYIRAVIKVLKQL